MPFLAVLASTAHVGRREDHALLQERQPNRGETRLLHNVEPAVASEQSWICPIQFEALFVDQEHGNSRAVFAGNEDLFAFVVSRMEAGNLGHAEGTALAGGDVVAENGGRIIQRCEGIKGLLIVMQAKESSGAPQAGQ